MLQSSVDRIVGAHAGLKTNFDVVPIEDIPELEYSEAARALRPVVLVVDDELERANRLTRLLDRNGYAVIGESDAENALETAMLMPPDLAVIDSQLPGKSAIALAISLREKVPDCIVLMVEGNAPETTLLGSVKAAHDELRRNVVEPAGVLAQVEPRFGGIV